MHKVPDNCIVISRINKKPGRLLIRSKSEFFKNELIIKVVGNSIAFRAAGIDDRNTRRPSEGTAKGWRHIEINANLPIGRFYFDPDESDCNKIVVYCTE